ncbi:uncharacterized protein LOC141719744 [Apium graveolens]|uniref:uncharacterized protein LOC141719744 n=1 Tax=Apium graveolens TaxID=4045 RepID=UPI003D7A0366
MIFMNKKHFKNTLRDYCIQEGFAITIIKADNGRYTITCLAACCKWRIHASKLVDGITWAIKKIDPATHSCRGLETYNPIYNVKWAAGKLMEDIRVNPDIPGYVKIICATNPDSKAFFAFTESESIRRGNYGGVLLSAVALDGNNGIFPIAYGVVSVEDKENWSFFMWNLYNILKESNRKDWTIISDRQKGIDLALEHRACNATSQFTFRKSMERLKLEGGDRVMIWFAQLGDAATWSKHKFDPNVCNDSNTSDFVESFNSTLGIDRCRPILTLLEGIRRVCMVRIASRHENALTWNDDDLCPKITKLVKKIGKDTISCKAYMSSPGEYEIHEGKSQFPLSLNNKICTCGAWQISGIPCRHAIRVMLHAKIDPQKVVSSWYYVRTYRKTYNCKISPVPDQDQWPQHDDDPIIMPPTVKRGGRKTMTCNGGLTGKQMKEMKVSGVPVVIRHPRKRDQSNAAKTARAAANAGASQASINMSQGPTSQSQP